MVSLCINRAGTVPTIDMSYYTPIVYIFSVLEVNIAILCASIPIFWPMISSFATDKILVVNEIVVHVEQYPKASLDGQPGIGLAEQGAWKSPTDSPVVPTQQPSRFGAIARAFDRRPSKESHAGADQRSRGSVASSVGKTSTQHELNRSATRSSQDSQNNLCPAISQESGTLTKSDYDWFAELDRECVGKRTITKIEKGENPFNTRRPSET
ncbi:hypothetical protein N0V95_003698 [Ascochyta clinopodiicola]|nr:hypothetical protein N0V95_003698 [Ascochyta clinopodiicola]